MLSPFVFAAAFNQTEQGRQQGGKGTGLGLALVRQIVKRSGGRLGVKSRVGKGSTFWVELRTPSSLTLLFPTCLHSTLTVPMLAALGIGSQAILLRSHAPLPLDDEEMTNGRSTQLPMGLVNSVPHELSPVPHLIIETAPRDCTGMGQPSSSGSGAWSSTGSQRSSSAMHTLMEQGGLVEIGPKADGSPLVITRTIEDTLALPTTPEAEAENPTNTMLLPSSSSLSPPSPGLLGQDGLSTPCLSPPVSERPEEPIPSSTSQDPSLIVANSSDSATAQVQPQPQPSFGGSDRPPTTVPPGLPVLVVDDDALTRTLMSRMLSRLGCKVWTAENGEVALEMVSSGSCGRFAVVFLDNQMPVMSGLAMVAKLREAGGSDFVVGITGNALLSDQEAYLQAGVDRCVLSVLLF
jgi:osomolarity two-component system, sensor histidine kinase SLN1